LLQPAYAFLTARSASSSATFQQPASVLAYHSELAAVTFNGRFSTRTTKERNSAFWKKCDGSNNLTGEDCSRFHTAWIRNSRPACLAHTQTLCSYLPAGRPLLQNVQVMIGSPAKQESVSNNDW
jgi:hypothetical protein